MKKYISLIAAAVVLIDVIISFVKDKEVENVFGIDLNVWVFRFLWITLALLLIQVFIKDKKKEE